MQAHIQTYECIHTCIRVGGEDYPFILALQYFTLYTHMYQGGEWGLSFYFSSKILYAVVISKI